MTENEVHMAVQKVKEALAGDPSLSLTSPAALPLVEAFLVNQARIAASLHSLLIHVRQK
jgi:hypothetical protein